MTLPLLLLLLLLLLILFYLAAHFECTDWAPGLVYSLFQNAKTTKYWAAPTERWHTTQEHTFATALLGVDSFASKETREQKCPLRAPSEQGPVSRKSRKRFGSEKPLVKLRTAYSVKLVFSYVIRGTQIKVAVKFRAARRLRFEDTKRIMSPQMPPNSFGAFEKRVPDAGLMVQDG